MPPNQKKKIEMSKLQSVLPKASQTGVQGCNSRRRGYEQQGVAAQRRNGSSSARNSTTAIVFQAALMDSSDRSNHLLIQHAHCTQTSLYSICPSAQIVFCFLFFNVDVIISLPCLKLCRCFWSRLLSLPPKFPQDPPPATLAFRS